MSRQAVWTSTRYWVRLAVLLAAGVLLPVVVHLINGVAGRTLLPIHIPTLLAGFLLGPAAGVIVGVLSPLLNFVLVGMPPLSPPLLPVVTMELVAYGLISGILTGQRWGWLAAGTPAKPGAAPTLPSYAGIVERLLITQVTGRVVLGLALAVVAPAVGWPFRPYAYVSGALATGWPGVVVQLLVVPVLIQALLRSATRR